MNIFRIRYRLVNGLHDVLIITRSEREALKNCQNWLMIADKDSTQFELCVYEILPKFNLSIHGMPVLS